MSIDKLPLSSTDWALLNIVCKLERPDIHQILEVAFQEETILDQHTTHKLLSRLIEKGYLETVQGQGRNLRYALQLDPDSVLRRTVEHFVNKVAGDDLRRLQIVQEVVDGIVMQPLPCYR